MKPRNINILRAMAVLVTLTSIYLFAPWQYGLYYLKPLPSTLQQELDQFIDEGIDGVVVYVDRKDHEPVFYTSGHINRDTPTPIHPDALFKIASIAKLYDAAAIIKLVGEGRVKLGGYLSDYLPETRGRIANADQITVQMLLQHRSGIPNFTDHELFHWGELEIDVIDLIYDQPANFKPGIDYQYSNSNYFLLQKIIAQITGAPHGEYIKRTLLKPLGLSNTYFSTNEVDKKHLVSGYHLGYDDDLRHLEHGYVSTAKEVAIFIRALNEGTFFSDYEAQLYSANYQYGHTGWVLGYQSVARYFEQEDMVVVQFVSTTGNDLAILNNILYERVIEIIRSI
ncbi:serine hydrolase [Alteromonas sp. RW2A1]|jgi:CubicO group peptidase (beta-lactamase class C family)|uniref:serine hydrolase domain-containing protein n=1 Tax=Alteromonas sp. RW2A1 TaxID=1917158 RepID=UPI000903A654|nr:serine hydrolase domain-containing protein [Alteromonas sp. RW2A1]APE05321.1 serine hydrolase [Alteromonas sp. RW2A1]